MSASRPHLDLETEKALVNLRQLTTLFHTFNCLIPRPILFEVTLGAAITGHVLQEARAPTSDMPSKAR
jgi:hypothetical protein